MDTEASSGAIRAVANPIAADTAIPPPRWGTASDIRLNGASASASAAQLQASGVPLTAPGNKLAGVGVRTGCRVRGPARKLSAVAVLALAMALLVLASMVVGRGSGSAEALPAAAAAAMASRCVDKPAEWHNTQGTGCATFAQHKLCMQNGSTGEGWHRLDGAIADWRVPPPPPPPPPAPAPGTVPRPPMDQFEMAMAARRVALWLVSSGAAATCNVFSCTHGAALSVCRVCGAGPT